MKIDKEAKHRFDYLAATICDKYCRYPLTWNEEAFGPLAESKTCEECPLTMFEKYVEVEGDRVPVDASEEAKAEAASITRYVANRIYLSDSSESNRREAEALEMAADALEISSYSKQWQELKETITEMRDNDGTGTQQEVCKFLANYMAVLEKEFKVFADNDGGLWYYDAEGKAVTIYD